MPGELARQKHRVFGIGRSEGFLQHSSDLFRLAPFLGLMHRAAGIRAGAPEAAVPFLAVNEVLTAEGREQPAPRLPVSSRHGFQTGDQPIHRGGVMQCAEHAE